MMRSDAAARRRKQYAAARQEGADIPGDVSETDRFARVPAVWVPHKHAAIAKRLELESIRRRTALPAVRVTVAFSSGSKRILKPPAAKRSST